MRSRTRCWGCPGVKCRRTPRGGLSPGRTLPVPSGGPSYFSWPVQRRMGRPSSPSSLGCSRRFRLMPAWPRTVPSSALPRTLPRHDLLLHSTSSQLEGTVPGDFGHCLAGEHLKDSLGLFLSSNGPHFCCLRDILGFGPGWTIFHPFPAMTFGRPGEGRR